MHRLEPDFVEEKLMVLNDRAEDLVKLRLERDDLNARISALENDINQLIGLGALKAKMFPELRAVMLMGESQNG